MQYINSLDLTEGDALMQELDEEQHHMHTQAITARKYFMYSKACQFLEESKNMNLPAQIIIMAAGISPLSASLAEQYPESKIFEIDLYSMEEKSKMLSEHFPNISFIEVDLENLTACKEKLSAHNYQPENRTMIIFEGIVYYLSNKSLTDLFKWSFKNKAIIIGDFCLPPELVSESNRKFPKKVFEVIRNLLSLPPIAFYSREEFLLMLNDAGYKNCESQNLREIHFERTNSLSYFEEEQSGWIELWKAAE